MFAVNGISISHCDKHAIDRLRVSDSSVQQIISPNPLTPTLDNHDGHVALCASKCQYCTARYVATCQLLVKHAGLRFDVSEAVVSHWLQACQLSNSVTSCDIFVSSASLPALRIICSRAGGTVVAFSTSCHRAAQAQAAPLRELISVA